MENLINYIKPELLILIPVLYLLGLAFKKASFMVDKYIPITLGICGIVLTFLYLIGATGWSVDLIWLSIIQGILCAGGAVYFNQIYKQLDR